MRRRKLICVDMDGTMLRDDQTISNETQQYFRDLVKQGYYIVITSGRPFRAIEKYYNQLGLNTPVVCINGGMIYLPKSKTILFRKTFDKDFVNSIISTIGEENFKYILLEDIKDNVYLKDDNIEYFFDYKEGMNVIYGPLKDKIQADLDGVILELNDSSLRVKLTEVATRIKGINFRFWENCNIGELYFTNVNKYTSLSLLAEIYNITNEDIICFGDAANDIEMIKRAGIGIAMKNGEKSVQMYSDMVSLEDNNHDGVMQTLKLLLAGNN